MQIVGDYSNNRDIEEPVPFNQEIVMSPARTILDYVGGRIKK